MHDARNVAPIERCLSFGAGALLGGAATYLLYRGVTGYCAIYAALGIKTSPQRGSHNANASVPYGAGVRVELEYAPPARYVGASLARILGEEPDKQIAEDLQRFKSIAERGEICAS